ncbi:hypothetical protein D6C13_05215 [Rahnella woolbedingensis]|uniref:Uncharacterized protein n=1 Tax=Rahnella woolbedingensis TaxID=1510574 RepID=A0A419NCK0_9GAMM|nr:hypothetical protein D6C13_05215 [Rahnella woolbedingensis]
MIQPQRLAGIPFILWAESALASFVHPSHILIYAPGDSLSCRLDSTAKACGNSLPILPVTRIIRE